MEMENETLAIMRIACGVVPGVIARGLSVGPCPLEGAAKITWGAERVDPEDPEAREAALAKTGVIARRIVDALTVREYKIIQAGSLVRNAPTEVTYTVLIKVEL